MPDTPLDVRQAMFPYGMAKNADGSWTIFNRAYKPLGVVKNDWAEWDDPRHKMFLKGLGPGKLAKLSYTGKADADTSRVYFYNDGSNPAYPENLETYFKRLKILIGLDFNRAKMDGDEDE